jgi:hypothetical protein
MRIRVGYVGGFVRLPKRRITRWTDQREWAASGMMFTDYLRILNRDRSDLSAALHEINYSIYSIKLTADLKNGHEDSVN